MATVINHTDKGFFSVQSQVLGKEFGPFASAEEVKRVAARLAPHEEEFLVLYADETLGRTYGRAGLPTVEDGAVKWWRVETRDNGPSNPRVIEAAIELDPLTGKDVGEDWFFGDCPTEIYFKLFGTTDVRWYDEEPAT